MKKAAIVGCRLSKNVVLKIREKFAADAAIGRLGCSSTSKCSEHHDFAINHQLEIFNQLTNNDIA